MFTKLIAVVAMATAAAAAYSASTTQIEKDRQRVEISKLIAAQNYGAIAQRAAQALTVKARFPDGTWRLNSLYASFRREMQDQISDDKRWERALDRLRREARKVPVAWLLYEEALSARAWSVRGPGFASEVSPDAMRGFRKYLVEARSVLDEHKGQLAISPAWFSMRITLALELNEDEAFARHLFDEGRQKYPSYHAIYFSRMRHLSPIWHGSKAQMLDFLDDIESMGPSVAQEGLYVRLVWFADTAGHPLVHEKRISTKAMRDGYDILGATYPDQWNVQRLFFTACEQSDKESALRLIVAVKEPLLPIPLGNLHLHQLCKDWAEGRLPMFIMRGREGGPGEGIFDSIAAHENGDE